MHHLDAVLVRLIVADPAEEVDVGVFDGLRSVKVVGHEFDAGEEFWRTFGGSRIDHFGKVLNDEAQIGEALGEFDADEAEAATDLGDGLANLVHQIRPRLRCKIGIGVIMVIINRTYIYDQTAFLIELFPRVVVNHVLDFIPLAARQALHGITKSLRALRVLRYVRKHGLARAMCQREGRLGWLLRARIRFHRLDRFGGSGKELVQIQTGPVIHLLVFE